MKEGEKEKFREGEFWKKGCLRKKNIKIIRKESSEEISSERKSWNKNSLERWSQKKNTERRKETHKM